MIKSTISASITFLLFLLLHFISFHYFIPNNKVNTLLLTALLGLGIYFILIYKLPNEEWFITKFCLTDNSMKRFIYPLLGIVFYGFLILGYLEFYFTADRSITFRMLMITDKQPTHSITQKEMFELYDVPGILNKRFSDLTYGGYYQLHGDTYQLTTKGKIILDIYKVAINQLHLGTGEKKQQTVIKSSG